MARIFGMVLLFSVFFTGRAAAQCETERAALDRCLASRNSCTFDADCGFGYSCRSGSCVLASSGGGCHDQAGTRECGSWSYQGVWTYPETWCGSIMHPNDCRNGSRSTRTCRTFDGCGNLTGQFEETNNDPAPGNSCIPCE
jgi:hypothetical protein